MKIKIQVILPYLLIALLTSSQFSIAMETGFTVNDDVEITRPAKQNPDPVNRFFATWETGRKVNENMKKVPSAPNPKGNRHPPSKPGI